MFNKIKTLWVSLPDYVKRVIHTFWQTFAGTMVVSVAGVHDLTSAKALVIAAVSAGLSAVRASLVARS